MLTDSIKLENRIEELSHLTEFLENFLTNIKAADNEIFSVTLVMEELFVNQVSYGYRDKIIHYINVNLEFNENDCEFFIHIEDDGEEFNILEKPDPNLSLSAEERPIGGLGIFFVKQKMDSVNYDRIKNLNHIYLKKKISLKK